MGSAQATVRCPGAAGAGENGEPVVGTQARDSGDPEFAISGALLDPFHRKRVTPDHFGVNVHCLEGFDASGFPVRQAHGAAMS